MVFEADFLQGQRDCQNGVEHQDGKGKNYDRGYAAEYQNQQNNDAITGEGKK